MIGNATPRGPWTQAQGPRALEREKVRRRARKCVVPAVPVSIWVLQFPASWNWRSSHRPIVTWLTVTRNLEPTVKLHVSGKRGTFPDKKPRRALPGRRGFTFDVS